MKACADPVEPKLHLLLSFLSMAEVSQHGRGVALDHPACWINVLRRPSLVYETRTETWSQGFSCTSDVLLAPSPAPCRRKTISHPIPHLFQPFLHWLHHKPEALHHIRGHLEAEGWSRAVGGGAHLSAGHTLSTKAPHVAGPWRSRGPT